MPGTLRDSLYILDGLLEQQTTLEPHELMTERRLLSGTRSIIHNLQQEGYCVRREVNGIE